METVEPAMARVVGVADSTGRAVREQDVGAGISPGQCRGAAQTPAAKTLLGVGVLIGPRVVAPAATEPADAQTADGDRPAVGIDGTVGSGVRRRKTGSRPAAPTLAIPVQITIVIAGHKDARSITELGEDLEVVEREVAGAEDDVGFRVESDAKGQRFHHLVGHRQNSHHRSHVSVCKVSESVTDTLGRFLRDRIGVEPQRASVTFLGVEPVEVLRFSTSEQVVYVTSGCSRHPMSDPTDLHADPVRGPRAELVVRMAAGSSLPGLHKRMATVAAAPAVEGLILAADALVDLGEPLWDTATSTAFLLDDDDLGEVPLTEPMDSIRLLRAVPITANEAAWVRLKGAAALREAWTEAGIDVTHADRSSANP